MPLDERVLCVPTSHVRSIADFQGFYPASHDQLVTLLDPRQFSFQPRSDCETNPHFKQLIPYVVLRCGPRLFHYRRGGGGRETRLTARRSIGIGGHICDLDARTTPDPYRTGYLRELSEEIDIMSSYSEQFLGFINDDSTPVGSVHLGIVHLIELSEPNVRPREPDIADAGFETIPTLLRDCQQFESWSRYAMTALS
jgi:predicted NUDIX family phosphoesterase